VDPADEERDPDRRLDHHHDARGQPRPAGRPPKAFESRALVVDRSWGEIRDAAVLGRRRFYARRHLVRLDTPARPLVSDLLEFAPMTTAELLGAVTGLALGLVVAFRVWRWRRLHLRRGASDLEFFGDRPS
jgi:hypothetical protein